MKLRTRLGLGIISITVVLLVPLILALRSLDSVHEQTRMLRDREFAASQLLGNLREINDDVKRTEDAVLLSKDVGSFSRIRRQIDELAKTSASLSRFIPREAGVDLTNAVIALRAATEAEMQAIESDAVETADEISAQRSRPAIRTIEGVISRSGNRLRDETHLRVEQAASTTADAQRTAAGSLAVALLLAALIALWLTRSISKPVYELDRGMKAVADGDFTQRLPVMEKRSDEFGRLANSYHGMTAQLAELDKLKAEFVSVASHELKTPINVIVGYLELLQESIYGELNPKQREICATLGKQAQTLTRLVKRLLDISRFEAGGGKLERRQVDLDRFLHAFETSFHVLALQREINFKVTRGGSLPSHVLWDEDRINEVLGNLLSNAFKFTDRGGSVELHVEGGESEVCIAVNDTGVGIDGEQLPHIFEKFFQASNQAHAAVKGTGLGLAIAREIVEAHGGSIVVESTLGSGTTFSIKLPVRAAITRRTPFRRTPVTEEVA